MKEKNCETIYLSSDEEIASIVDKLEQCDKREITLAVPQESALLQSVVNLKILKKRADELGKKVSIITINGEEKETTNDHRFETVSQAQSSGNVIKTEAGDKIKVRIQKDKEEVEKEIDRKTGSALENKGKVAMFDIVKRVGGSGVDRKSKETSFVTRKVESRKLEDAFKERFGQSEEKVTMTERRKRRIILLPSISSKVFVSFIFISLVTVLASAAFALPKADIDITLRTNTVAYDFEFVADEFASEVDVASGRIPAKRIEVRNKEVGNYPATGKKEVATKASGNITIFNEFSSAPQRIIANTRFLSKEGYIFRIKEPVTIPGFSVTGGKKIPGQVTVKVYADKPGEEYNIGATSFTLPGLQGTRKYSAIYAKSMLPMTGGARKGASYFSESDYIMAKEKLIEAVKEKNEQDFLSKLSDEDIVLEDTKKREDIKVESSVKVGDVADSFQMTVSFKTSVLVVKKADLDKLAKEKAHSKLASNRELVEGSGKYEIGKMVKNENGQIVIPTYASWDSVVKIDAEQIKREISGKSEAELREYFRNMKGVKVVKVNFWPFWVKSVPISYDKINISVNYSSSS